MKLLTNLDLGKNQILNVALQNLAVHPGSPANGQIYYNTTDKAVYFYDGTAWQSVLGDITSVNAGNGLTGGGASGTVSLGVLIDGSTLSVSASGVKISSGGVSATELASNAVTTIKLTDKNVTFAKIQDVATMTVLGRVTAGTGVTESIGIVTDLANASASTLATSTAIKTYVDNTLTGFGNLEGSFDATNTTFPVGSGGGTKKGDYWYVSTPGNIGGLHQLNTGDVLIANKDNASTTSAADWIFLESNFNQATTTVLGLVKLATNALGQGLTDTTSVITPAVLGTILASETQKGIAQVATQAQSDAGTDDTTIVTPKKLKATLDSRTGGYAVSLGDGVATAYSISHNLGTLDVIIDLVEVSTGATVYTDISRTSTTTINISFSVAPTTNQFRVVIKK